MSEGLLTIAKEFEQLEEHVTRLTASNDRLRVVNDINNVEMKRMQQKLDAQFRELTSLRAQLSISNAALYKAGFAITEAVSKIPVQEEQERSEFAPRPRRVVP